MADISKIKLANGTTVTLKDAQGRADMTTILGGHAIEALGAAAWKAVAAEVNGGGADLPTAEAVKSYVDSAVGKVHNFDVVIDPNGTAAGPATAASADTMYKIYMVADEGASAGSYIEWITIRSGAEGAYTYAWEKIGSTKTDLAGYVSKETTIAGIALDKNISVEQLQSALQLGSMAYADKGTATVASKTVTGVKATGTSTGSISVKLDQTKTEATLTKAAYKPAGSITGDAIKGGSISVTLKDAATKTAAELGTTTFTPAGTVAAVKNGDFQALKTVSLNKSDTGAIQIEGTVSKPAIDLTASNKTFVTGLTGGSKASFKEGVFTPAAFQEGFYTAGSAATWTGKDYVAPSMGEATKAAFASEGVTAAIDAEDAECLTFTAAATAQAVTAQGAFNAGKVDFGTFNGGSATLIDITKFSGGAKAKDTFVANELQGVSTGAVSEVTAASLQSAPSFTGAKYNLDTTADTALKTVAFTATNSADIVNKVEYVKQDINSADFTPVAATLGFSGTEVADLIPTKVEYNVASVNAAGTKFTGADIELDVGAIVVPSQTIEVSPVSKS